MVVTMKLFAFWSVTPCSQLGIKQYCRTLRPMSPWKYSKQFKCKNRSICASPYDVISRILKFKIYTSVPQLCSLYFKDVVGHDVYSQRIRKYSVSVSCL